MKKNKTLFAILKNYYLFIRDLFSDLFDDKLGHYASSLSWNTLFSIIPLLVVLLWIFTRLPMFDSVYKEIEEIIFANLMPTDSTLVMQYINQFIENADKLGFVGIFYVIFGNIMFFKNYDFIVNDVFSTPKRNFFQAFKNYLLLLFVIPIMMTSSVYLSINLQPYLDSNSITSIIHLYALVPYFIVWMMFFIAYLLSANKTVETSPALISSFIASLVWYISKSGFVFFVLYNKTYTSIYGSVSIFLFFFLWIYISWAIFIHGLKFCDLLNKDEDIDRI